MNIGPTPDDLKTESQLSAGSVLGRDSNQDHFKTDHLLKDLKGRTVSSAIVTVFAQGIQFFLGLGSTMILARLLTPHDFGLIAMVTTITGFLRIFNEAGLSTATIQREGITHAQVSNLFWMNVALGGMVTAVLACAAPGIAWFYREPRLVGVVLALCGTFILSSSAVQHLALLNRQMRFRVIATIQVISTTAGVLVGLTMALRNCGYWALVIMQLTPPLVSFFLSWSFSKWRPQLPKRNCGTRSLLHFGANLTAGNFLYSIARGSDGLLIGRFYGAASLGIYNRALVLVMRPIQQFIGPFEAVFVPALSRLQSQPERYCSAVLEAYDFVAMTSFLFTGLLLGLARPLTLAMLGHQWEDAAPIFAVSTIIALTSPLASAATWLLTSQGRGKDALALSSVVSCLTIICFLIGLPFGPKGVATSYSIFCIFVDLPIVYHIAGRQGPVKAKDLWSRFLTHLPLWIIVCGVTWSTRFIAHDANPWIQLVVRAPVGLLAGVAFICIYPPTRRTGKNLIRTLQEFRKNRKT